MAKQPPTNRALGRAGVLLGLGGALFGTFALLMTAMQRAIVAAGPPPPEGFGAIMEAIHGVWWIHLPLWIVGGSWFVWWGRALGRDDARAAGMLRLGCCAAVVGLIVYAAHVAWVMPGALGPIFDGMPVSPAWFVLGAVPVFGAMCVPFVVFYQKLGERVAQTK